MVARPVVSTRVARAWCFYQGFNLVVHPGLYDFGLSTSVAKVSSFNQGSNNSLFQPDLKESGFSTMAANSLSLNQGCEIPVFQRGCRKDVLSSAEVPLSELCCNQGCNYSDYWHPVGTYDWSAFLHAIVVIH
jgi:hypothetical protein